VLQDLFFKYTWNNFLHTQVQQCLALAINYGQRDNDIIYNNVSYTTRMEINHDTKILNNLNALISRYLSSAN